MVLFISLGSVCAASDVCESVDVNEGVLNSVDNNDTTYLEINELSNSVNTCDNGSVDISNESNDYVNDYNSESNTESNNNCDDDYESDYNVEINNDYNENINDLKVSGSESNENNTCYNNTFNNSNSSDSFTISQIMDAAGTLKSYVLANQKLPSTVKVNGKEISIAQFSYLMTIAIININAKNSSNIGCINISTVNPFGDTINKNILLKDYLTVAGNIASFIKNNNYMPNYATAGGLKAEFKLYTYAFAKILVFYKDEKYLPNYCLFDSGVFKSPTVTISQVISSSVSLKSYVLKYGVLPSTVTVNGVKYSTGQFAYLMSVAIQYLKAGKKVSTKISVKSVSVKSGSNYAVSKTLSLASCVSMAKTISSSVSKNGYVPAYVTVSGTKYDYRDYTYAFAKILAWYKNNKNKLPKTCAFESKVFKSSSSSSSSGKVTISQVISSSVSLKSYVLKYGVLPSTVTVNGVKYSTGQFAYLMSVAIQYLKAGKKVSTKISVKSVSVKSGSNYAVSKTLSLASCVSMAKTISSSVSKNGYVPAYVTVSGTKYDYRDYTYAFAKILAWYKNNKNKLPKTCAFESKVFKSSSSSSSGAISGITYKKGINEVGSGSSSAYLASSGNAVITTAIKDLAKSLTKNCKSDLDKATVLFNYVRDKIDYSYYYNTKYKASGTLTYKKGNCCDKSNLLVALCRASGLSSRYCHSTSCTFNSGLVCGHVWVQINVDGVWYAADTTSSRNTLGHINNWKTGSMGKLNQYSSLPF